MSTKVSGTRLRGQPMRIATTKRAHPHRSATNSRFSRRTTPARSQGHFCAIW